VAPQLLEPLPMDKQQDADLEKDRESIEAFFDDDRTPLFDDYDDDIFEEHVSEENEFEYEPEGAFLD
jgi:hypothetical protein